MRYRSIGAILPAIVTLLSFTNTSAGQVRCVEPKELQAAISRLSSAAPAPKNEKLSSEAVKLSKDLAADIQKARIDQPKSEKAQRQLAETEAEAIQLVCGQIAAAGWPKREELGDEGALSFLYLLTKALPAWQQLELYPLVSEAYARGEIRGGEILAAYVDKLRLALGRRQLYGSQVTINDGFLVMAPIERASEVDKRRSAFGMQPLRSYERFLELTYRMPLIRAVMEPTQRTAEAVQEKKQQPSVNGLFDAGEEEAIKVQTAYVSLDVVIRASTDVSPVELEKGDFRLFDNGKPVEIESFAKTDTPFDIVLLLDLSGSTADKVGLIKKTTRRFIEMKRPDDRVAVVTFHNDQTVVSELEADKNVLLERVKKIEGRGGSYIWDAVKFGIDLLEKGPPSNRRKAIVLMSDGGDNLLTYYPTQNKRMGFADLIEAIQRSTVSIFPIFLDTSGDFPASERFYQDSRRTLAYMAEQSAGTLYTARKLEDVAGVYDRVLKDVGTIYTIGFTPDIDENGPEWRPIRVEVPSRPELKLRYRPGYFVR